MKTYRMIAVLMFVLPGIAADASARTWRVELTESMSWGDLKILWR